MVEVMSTKHAPWYLVPANNKPFGRLAAFRIIADRLSQDVALEPRVLDPKVMEAARQPARYYTSVWETSGTLIFAEDQGGDHNPISHSAGQPNRVRRASRLREMPQLAVDGATAIREGHRILFAPVGDP